MCSKATGTAASTMLDQTATQVGWKSWDILQRYRIGDGAFLVFHLSLSRMLCFNIINIHKRIIVTYINHTSMDTSVTITWTLDIARLLSTFVLDGFIFDIWMVLSLDSKAGPNPRLFQEAKDGFLDDLEMELERMMDEP